MTTRSLLQFRPEEFRPEEGVSKGVRETEEEVGSHRRVWNGWSSSELEDTSNSACVRPRTNPITVKTSSCRICELCCRYSFHLDYVKHNFFESLYSDTILNRLRSICHKSRTATACPSSLVTHINADVSGTRESCDLRDFFPSAWSDSYSSDCV